jgi:hypothetical protein
MTVKNRGGQPIEQVSQILDLKVLVGRKGAQKRFAQTRYDGPERNILKEKKSIVT